ncbi:transporter substrate-binding domain-containing protein [Pseudomonas sp. SL4(2022)]|uniref:substrate-binding periplasmic protein n=1 Tax=Pseudomonas sp. SL4(2022) TaxID=2994661 RepID=UPI002270B95D|nr:transporter substrate-binding domain-containing protein [Pseudomonas sp. SL4(2022)]WAC43071.1 transporter substrate-binding domain-containing protein [Pseudomonas sp. SL4(2022)]
MPQLIYLALTAIFYCSSSFAAPADTPKPLVQVGYYEFAPYSYTDRSGQPQGAMLQLSKRLLEHAGYRAELRSYPSARLYNALQDGSVQVWPGAPGKPELREHTLETRALLGEIILNLYFRQDTQMPRLPEDLKGRGVIMISGYTYWHSINRMLADPQLGIRQHRTGTHTAALEMLQRRRGDFLLDYQATVEQARQRLGMSELPFIELQRIPLKLIVSRHTPGAEALRDALDRAYAELQAAGEDLRLP